jgi:hypothetical protein
MMVAWRGRFLNEKEYFMRNLIFYFLLFSNLLFCNIYFVDQKNPSSSDENSGTENSPFKTLKKAGEVAGPGDTVIVKEGIYREILEVKNSGTPDKPIIFKVKDGDKVFITGADIVKGWEKFEDKRPIWIKKNWEYKIWARGEEWKWRAEQVVVDDNLYDQVFSLKEMKPGSFLWDNDGKSLYIWLIPRPGSPFKELFNLPWWETPVNLYSDNPNERQVEVGIRSVCIKVEEKENIIISGFHIKYCANQAQFGAISVKGKNITIENCIVEFTNGVGISFSGENILIRNNISRYNGEAGAGSGFSKNLIFENNILLRNNYKGHSHGWEGGGIKICKSEKAIIRENKFIENNGPGLWLDWGNKEFIIEKNLSVRNIGSGIMVEVSPETPEDYKGPFKPGIIRNNISAFNKFDGTWGSGILLQLSSYTYILHNTVYGNEQFGIFLRYHPYANYGGGKDKKENIGYIHTLKNNVIMYNIVANNKGGQIYISPDPKDKPGAVKDIICDFNIFWDEENWNFIEYATKKRMWENMSSWSKWGKTETMGTYSVEERFKITGYDENSFQWDPKFVSPESLDFHVLPGSFAIGAARPHSFVEDDFYGKPRPRDRNPTIGAVEYIP